MHITGTHFNYFMVCKRKLWLFAKGINMETTSELVYEGKLIQEISYERRNEKYEEIEMDGIKIDYYDPKDNIIHEVKKSNSFENAHEWQLKFYLYTLKQYGIEGVTGLLEYPRMRKTYKVMLKNDDTNEIEKMRLSIENIIQSENCPEKKKKSLCRNCSYFDLCWSGEE